MAKPKGQGGGVTFQGLLAERVANDAGQASAIKALGVSQSMISRWMRGIDTPRDERVPALAAFLNRSENEVAVLLSEARRRRQTIPERVTALEEEVQELGGLVQALIAELER